MAPLLLVYRGLREASDWMLNYYSEIAVFGEENVQSEGPLLVVPCHHNEVVDIGALSVTIAHGRPVRFWAKASLFRIPLIRNILASSGALPVHRKRNIKSGSSGCSHTSDSRVHDTLFEETVVSLSQGEVIGLFPEGTSYTHPHIPPLKPGAARVALEYASRQFGLQTSKDDSSDLRSGREQLKVVPVGIVYTDKMQFRSRVCVIYGKPIGFHPFARQYSTGTDEDRREAINALTYEIQENLIKLTVNAPDWDVYLSAHIARDLAYDGRVIPLEDYVPITQRFVNTLKNSSPETTRQVAVLLKYHALLRHTNIPHETFSSLYPFTSTHSALPTRGHALKTFLAELTKTFLHPRLWLFIPPLLLHLPGYLVGNLGARYIVDSTLDETQAGTIAICCGITYGVTAGLTTWKLYDFALRSLASEFWKLTTRSNFLDSPWGWFWSRSLYHVGLAVSVYAFTRIVFRWHNLLVDDNLNQFRRLTASFKLLMGLLRPGNLTNSELVHFSRPPPKPLSPLLKGAAKTPKEQEDISNRSSSISRVTSLFALIVPLWNSRIEAVAVVKELVAENRELVVEYTPGER